MKRSAANYNAVERADYLTNAQFQYKEVIGLWNGETRFVASVIPEGVGPQWDFNVYNACIELGAVDVDNAQAGELAVNNSVTPVIVKGSEQVTFNQGTTNITESPLKNILLTYLSLFIDWPRLRPFPPLEYSVHISLTSSNNLLYLIWWRFAKD